MKNYHKNKKKSLSLNSQTEGRSQKFNNTKTNINSKNKQ